MGETALPFDLENLVQHFLGSSVPNQVDPTAVLMLGPVAVGKTTLRRQRYGEGFALVDAAAVFVLLSGGERLDFPGPLETLMEVMGQQVADQAVKERRNLVTELIGTDVEPVIQMINALKDVGYNVQIETIYCDLEESIRRNEARGEDNVSAYYAEDYQRKWLLYAAVWDARRHRAADAP